MTSLDSSASETRTLITVASWEDRFRATFDKDIAEWRPSQVLMYHLDGYADWSDGNRAHTTQVCRDRNIPIIDQVLGVGTPAENWKRLLKDVPAIVAPGTPALVDFTTMPREFIWNLFWLLDMVSAKVEFVYSRPASYNKEWLSRDPQKPRLVYKLSGIASLGNRTCLVVLAGYDIERTQQLINFYEPGITLLGLQAGDGDKDNAEKMAVNIKRFGSEPHIQCFEVNGYSSDQGQAQIEARVAEYLGSHNVIMSSLGPKLTAVSLYRMWRKNPTVGLTYAPSKEFNKEYSSGTGPTFMGRLWP